MSGQPSGLRRLTQSRHAVVAALGITQILGYGTTFYLLAVLALPMSKDTGWPLDRIAIGLSIGLLVGALAAPAIGRAIDRHGGRVVLITGSLCMALGLAGVGLSTHLPLYWLAWAVIGLGMAAALYEAAFSALGGWYREEARGPITAITLWGGFASTVCWPAAAYLVGAVGWRWTCLVFAACHVVIALPLHAGIMPRRINSGATSQMKHEARATPIPLALFVMIAAGMALASVIVTVISVHLIPVLQDNGFTVAAAVSIGALIGPSQVAGRFGELLFGRRLHPLWSALAAAIMMVAGVVILTHNVQLAAVAIVVYAMGAGVSYVVRGTLPLALFGADGYATIMGRLVAPSLIAQAVAPWIAALILERWGSPALLYALVVLTLLNVAAIGGVALSRRNPNG
ncbi:MFS transporter [Pseudorhodoplanes sp.]|uniref:MFS transporter n=1 Tax=Pseudorhodoplanes sp. TaxID=1934341 RepID=UPI002C132DE9|nr:MFS transporter [Pseudorhodoplanes sp.]HWV52776.1 MFS transporter [Pseudorhodoplanes sp.]